MVYFLRIGATKVVTIAVGCSAGLLHCPACVEDVVPRLDTGPRYNVAARVSVWFSVWGRGPWYNVRRFHGGHAVVRPPVVCSRLVFGCPF